MNLSIGIVLLLLVVVNGNDRPVVGILTQPTTGRLSELYSSRISVSYVKWLEASGARVVPVFFDDEESTKLRFSQINGIVFPGGPDIINHTSYYDSAKWIFDSCKKAKMEEGEIFPIWGTCLGFEVESMIVANEDFGILSFVNSSNVSLKQNFVKDPIKGSRMLSQATQELIDALEDPPPLAENYHHWGLLLSTWNRSAELQDFFNLISTSTDLDGRVFLSMWEALDFPIYGVQWHPERSVFEWDPTEHINHSPSAVEVAQFLANFFIGETRRSTHKFNSETEINEALIENYKVEMSDDSFYYLFGSKIVEVSSCQHDNTRPTIFMSVIIFIWVGLTAWIAVLAFCKPRRRTSNPPSVDELDA